MATSALPLSVAANSCGERSQGAWAQALSTPTKIAVGAVGGQATVVWGLSPPELT